MKLSSISKQELVLRIGIFGSFLGHGVFALMIKKSWIPYLTIVGFSEQTATTLLFLIGLLDLCAAVLALFKPLKLVLIWAAIWGFATALIRPIAGYSVLDFVERFPNWAAPLALLIIQEFPQSLKDLFKE